MPQRRLRGCGPSEGLQGLPAVQDRPILQRRVSESGLDNGWAQGDVWHIGIYEQSKVTSPLPLSQWIPNGNLNRLARFVDYTLAMLGSCIILLANAP